MVNPRAPKDRLTAYFAVLVMVLALVLPGGGVAAQAPETAQAAPDAQVTPETQALPAAQETPDAQEYGPATPEELEALEAAEQNVGAPDDPVFEGGYPASMPEAAEVSAAAALDAWSANWATGQLCVGANRCLVGDFNGDDVDDVAVIQGDGSILVATSRGAGFRAAAPWAGPVCLNRVCRVGDVNADGRDDMVIFNHGADESQGQVWVVLSQGNSFGPAQLWHNLFCIRSQICQVGNVDGAGGDDIVVFWRNDVAGAQGRVDVALSVGSVFGPAQRWHSFFCINEEECRVADMNGDNADDIVAFVKTGPGKGRVAVATSSRASFVNARDWATDFCMDADQCEVGDFDGSGTFDALKFVRSGSGGTTYGDVYVRLASSNGLGELQRWHDSFCFPGEDCAVGDFNGDGRYDAIRFVKQSVEPGLVGAAYVALASGTPFGFVPSPEPDGRWLQGFCRGGETCGTGDFNGDGLTDVVFFVKDTQTNESRGDVYVALNQGGVQFGTPTRWQDFVCVGQDICKVGDVDADGDDDLIIFSRVQNGFVYVSRSTGSSFEAGQIWNPTGIFCAGAEVCDVGDFNGDGRADIILFTRSTYGANERAGDVEVAINTGAQFVNTGLWHRFFCIGSESCQVGDFNSDGRDDIVTFAKGSNAKVYVELSNGFQFGDREPPAEQWQTFFCAGNEVCDVGDVNGDGSDDVISFLQGGYPQNPITFGDVYVGLSFGSAAAGGFVAQKWSDYFCITGEICETGYFNRDNRKDIVTFTRGTGGAVFVALANAGSGYFFRDAIPIPADALRRHLPLVLMR